jgi:hypothetical protein
VTDHHVPRGELSTCLNYEVDVVDHMFNDLILLVAWAVRLHCDIVSHRYYDSFALRRSYLLQYHHNYHPLLPECLLVRDGYSTFISTFFFHHHHHDVIGPPSLRPVFYDFDNGAFSAKQRRLGRDCSLC